MAAATHKLIAHAGLDAATMAAVAREAGFSVGTVQHYFASKDELLLFAYKQMTEHQLARVARKVAAGEDEKLPIREILRRCMPELWPLDEVRRGEYRVAKAFHARALDVPNVAEVGRQTAAVVRGEIARAVENGKECGEVEPDTDAERAALELRALITGLADELYSESARHQGDSAIAEVAAALLQSRLDSYFPGDCHHHDR